MSQVNHLFDENFLEYASYVIKDRAIPHIIDGMKPVQRRIIQSLFDKDDGKFHKVANIVGHCMQYHPHGDASIYAALVNLANKDLFIDKQGNFGNLYTGDPASASRYIECRLLPLAKVLLYNPELTEYVDSYDGRKQEPVVLPCKIPLLLINGTEGIAVGMATKILSHNFIEVLEALRSCLLDEPFELLPDFHTGGYVDVREYQQGNGKVLARAKLDTSDSKRIVIRELPFGQTTESLIASIEQAARKNKIKVGSITDFTAETVEIEVKLPRGVHADDVKDSLYAFTECETSISVNMLVIEDEKPVIYTTERVIQFHKINLMALLKKELELEARHLKEDVHARTLERIFIEERLYKPLEEIDNKVAITKSVFDGLAPFQAEIGQPVTAEDVERLLRIPIRRISLYDLQKMLDEIKKIEKRLAEIRKHLKNLNVYAVAFLDKLIETYKQDFPRRTEITEINSVSVRQVVQRTLNLNYDSATGYLGYALTTGKLEATVSTYDKIIIIKKDGSYSVMNVPDKIFIGKNILYVGLADPEITKTVTFSLLYMNKETKFPYIKRFKITKFILNKDYTLVPEGCKLLKLTAKDNVKAVVEFDQASLFKEIGNEFNVSNYLVKGVKAQGVRIKNKPCTSAKFIKDTGVKAE